ncbi:CHAP domain-containing protein [Altererythrobacter indicus]|uniref:CHAP domain-containing protein n=2 Tax=Altericroceibacterium indicum TaxID=374177 RepID=A0A845A8W9_9SPHN|nr:CHAP domain-containing protein [Altericroceibacterium indicum]MXP25779.1 CHAP domain-containing protein [Altericroceibacterium indicum]
MKYALYSSIIASLAVSSMPAVAGRSSVPDYSGELPAYVHSVDYARDVSGITIYGDAMTWWNKAALHYKRGHSPKVGAVMAFKPHGNLRLGHVATVSKILDKRRVLLRHADWSPINGQRGQIENDVLAVDVSPRNDWSAVRVWYAPNNDLGATKWPVYGFIYNDGSPLPRVVPPQRKLVAAPVQVARSDTQKDTREPKVTSRSASTTFQAAFSDF